MQGDTVACCVPGPLLHSRQVSDLVEPFRMLVTKCPWLQSHAVCIPRSPGRRRAFCWLLEGPGAARRPQARDNTLQTRPVMAPVEHGRLHTLA